MFSRIVDFLGRPGKTRQLKDLLQTRVLPTLRVQPGFVDEITLFSDTEPDRVLTLDFWKTRGDAERFSEEVYPRVKELLYPSLDTDPVVRTFDVETSAACKMATGRAAW
jgi:hypothetical protein